MNDPLLLQPPRTDGKCTLCQWYEAVTRDRRLCHKCLCHIIQKLTPYELSMYERERRFNTRRRRLYYVH